MSDENILLSPCTNRTQRLNAYERVKQFERKQGALEELKKINEIYCKEGIDSLMTYFYVKFEELEKEGDLK